MKSPLFPRAILVVSILLLFFSVGHGQCSPDTVAPVLTCQAFDVEISGSAVTMNDLLLSSTVEIHILTDEFPGETSWELKNSNGTVLESDQNFTGENTLYTYTYARDCGEDLTFTIMDSFGDGICCGLFGNGYYQVYVDGVLVGSGGNFNSTESVSFTTGTNCLPDYDQLALDSCGVDTIYAAFDSLTCADTGLVKYWVYAVDSSGNIDSCEASFNITDGPPEVACEDLTVYLNASGSTVSIENLLESTVTDVCGLDSIGITGTTDLNCDHLGDNSLTIYAVDVNGNSTTCTLTASVLDTFPPTAVCVGDSISLDSDGSFEVSGEALDGGSTDNCGVDSWAFSGSTSTYSCSDTGTVISGTLTVSDASGNSATCAVNTTLYDLVPPMLNCGSQTLSLNGDSTLTITLDDLFGPSDPELEIHILTDNFPEETSIALRDASNSIIFEQTDGSFSSDATLYTFNVTLDCASDYTFTIEDEFGDGICCGLFGNGYYQLYLEGSLIGSGGNFNSSESVSFTTDSCFTNFITDNCSLDSVWLTDSTFSDCNVGYNDITIYASDASGNVDSCTYQLGIEDSLALSSLINCNTTSSVVLDSLGDGSLSVTDILNAQSIPCYAFHTLTDSIFDCSFVGDTTVDVFVYSTAGSYLSCTSTVTISDATAPEVSCSDVTLYLNGTGAAELLEADLSVLYSDACGIDTSYLDLTSFTCSDSGGVAVTLSVADINGNTGQCTATVTLLDSISPALTCPASDTVYLEATGSADLRFTDFFAQGEDSLTLTILTDNFPGETSWQFLDENGTPIESIPAGSLTNQSSTYSWSLGVDCGEDYTLILGDSNGDGICCGIFGDGNYTLTQNGDTLASGGSFGTSDSTAFTLGGCYVTGPPFSDNCSVDATGVVPSNLSRCDAGTQSIQLYASDVSGNTDSCSVSLTVIDTFQTALVCTDTVVYLDGAGSATIDSSYVLMATSFQACAYTSSISQSSFDCTDLGTQSVSLTLLNTLGGTESCTATVTLLDTIAPTATCQDITVWVDGTGSASIQATEVNNSSSDVCGVDSLSIDISTFTCLNPGINTVTLSVTDSSGNTGTCTAIVTLADTLSPTITCPADTLIQASSASCDAVFTYSDPVSTDNCSSVVTLSSGQGSGGTFPVGASSELWIATDSTGNSDSCSFTITVSDTTNPALSCSDTTVYIDSVSTLTVDETYINAVYSDACGIGGISFAQTNFTCVDRGSNTLTFTVTDVNGNSSACTPTLTVISDSLMVILDATVQACGDHISCNGASDGSLTAIASGGCNVYEYLWSNGAITATVSGLSAGTYSVIVSDTLGDTTSASFTLTEPTALMTSAVYDSAVCANAATGAIDLTVSGGNTCGNYTYSWNSGSTSEDLTGLAPGTYTITVTDTLGCTSTESFVLNSYTPVQVDLGTDPAICSGDTTLLTAGTGYSAYLWSTGDSTSFLSISASATYGVTVTDGNGCVTSDSATLSLYSLPTPDLGADTTLCNGETTLLSPGTYSGYDWTSGSTAPVILVSNSGTYGVTVTDGNGCSGADSVVVTLAPSIVPGITSGGGTSFCDGDSVSLTADGGYTGYVWSSGDTTQTVTFSTAGTYSVTVTDSIGCTGSNSVTLQLLVPVQVDLGNDPSVCDGDTATLDAGSNFTNYLWTTGDTTSSLSISASASYGVTVTDGNGCVTSDSVTLSLYSLPTPDLGADTTLCNGETTLLSPGTYSSYDWTSGSTAPVILVSNSGTYGVTVTDGNGCSGADSVVVTLASSIVPGITSGGGTSFCDGDSVSLTADGGYTGYVWSSGDTTQTVTFNTAGTYTVTVTDSIGCTGANSETLQLLVPVQVDLGNDPSVCDGDTATLDAGSNFTNYLWTTGDTTSMITVATAGNYGITVTDGNGCQSADSITLTVHALPLPDLGPDSTICDNSTILLSAGTFSMYTWSTGSTSPVIQANSSTTYWVNVTDGNGCTGSDTTQIIVAPPVTTNITPDGSTILCNGDSVNLAADSGFVAYLWSTGAAAQSISVSGQGGTYTVTVTDSVGCTGSNSIDVEYFPAPAPFPVVSPGPNVNLCAGTSVTLDAGSGYATYEWNTGVTNQQLDVTQPASFTVTVSNFFGCFGTSDTVFVTELPVPVPVISKAGAELVSNISGLSYQWYLDSTAITGAIDSIYTPDTTGTFYLVVTDINGCEGSSNSIFCEVVGLEPDLTNDFGLVLYPNPTSGISHLKTLRKIPWNLEIRITDLYGKVIQTKSLPDLSDQVELDLTSVAAGVYIVEVHSERGPGHVFRLVVE